MREGEKKMINDDNHKTTHTVIQYVIAAVKIINYLIRLTARVTVVVKQITSIGNVWKKKIDYLNPVSKIVVSIKVNVRCCRTCAPIAKCISFENGLETSIMEILKK